MCEVIYAHFLFADAPDLILLFDFSKGARLLQANLEPLIVGTAKLMN